MKPRHVLLMLPAAALVVAYFWLAFVIAAPVEHVSRCVEVKPRIAVCAPGAERYKR